MNSHRKKFEPIIKELKYFLLKKFSISFLNYGFVIQDPVSGKTYPGSRIQCQKTLQIPDPGYGSGTLVVGM
jgi:hypothetical protein